MLANFYPTVVNELKAKDTKQGMLNTTFDILFFDEYINNIFPQFAISYEQLIGKNKYSKIKPKDLPIITSKIEEVLREGFIYLEGDCHAEIYVANQNRDNLFVHRLTDESYGRDYWKFGESIKWLKTHGSSQGNDEILEKDLGEFDWEFGEKSKSRLITKCICDKIFNLHTPTQIISNITKKIYEGKIKINRYPEL